jgi:hypothetical protein
MNELKNQGLTLVFTFHSYFNDSTLVDSVLDTFYPQMVIHIIQSHFQIKYFVILYESNLDFVNLDMEDFCARVSKPKHNEFVEINEINFGFNDHFLGFSKLLKQ